MAKPPGAPSIQTVVIALSVLLILGIGLGLALKSANHGQNDSPSTSNSKTLQPGQPGVPGAPGEPLPPGTVGRISFVTEPPGATLFVNGRLIGGTPLSEDFAPGTYGVRFEKEGRAPAQLHVEIGKDPMTVAATLPTLELADLNVEIAPQGAEVLLDGELLGLTPLSRNDIPVGMHELEVRKTNYNPYHNRILVQAGRNEYSGIELEDKILKMLIDYTLTEKQRVSHYIDLAHYYFVNNRIDLAVETFIKAREVSERGLEFPTEAIPEERALEQRLRMEDKQRLSKELDKHKRWQPPMGPEFREKYDRAEELFGRRNLGSWAWVEASGRDMVVNGNYPDAEQLYLGHLKAVPKNAETVYPCTRELLRVRLWSRNLPQAVETAATLMDLCKTEPARFLEIGRLLMSFRDLVRPNDRLELLELAEKAFRLGLENAKVRESKAENAFELAQVLVAEEHAAEAVAYFQQSVDDAPKPEVGEERALPLAEALRQAGRVPEARAIYERLAKSERPVVRSKATSGLALLKAQAEGKPEDQKPVPPPAPPK